MVFGLARFTDRVLALNRYSGLTPEKTEWNFSIERTNDFFIEMMRLLFIQNRFIQFNLRVLIQCSVLWTSFNTFIQIHSDEFEFDR